MAKSKLIVVWGSEGILSSSIEMFLATKENWKVIRISKQEEMETLLQAVETTHSDIVIIQQACHGDWNGLPLQLMQDHPAIQVITISLEDNLMDIYSKKKIFARQISDLLTVIDNEA